MMAMPHWMAWQVSRSRTQGDYLGSYCDITRNVHPHQCSYVEARDFRGLLSASRIDVTNGAMDVSVCWSRFDAEV